MHARARVHKEKRANRLFSKHFGGKIDSFKKTAKFRRRSGSGEEEIQWFGRRRNSVVREKKKFSVRDTEK